MFNTLAAEVCGSLEEANKDWDFAPNLDEEEEYV